jgi:hypothetical protein
LLKNILKNNDGSILVFVLFLFASIMVIISSLLALSNQNYNGVITQQLNARAYYLTLETSDIVIASLLKKPEEGGGVPLINKYCDQYLDDKEPITDSISFDDLGESKVKLIFEEDSELSTETEKIYWAVVYITTKIPDYRVSVKFKPEENPTYELYYELRILVQNTNIRTFNIINEDRTAA